MSPSQIVTSSKRYRNESTRCQATIVAILLAVAFSNSPQVVSAADTPPTIIQPASANPAVVTAKTTTLSAVATDDAGASTLIYAWSLTGTPPATVTFSKNNTNAAKTTVATFKKAGAYSFLVTITDTGNQSVTSSVNVTVNVTLTTIAATPNNKIVNVGGTQQYTATAKDQFATLLSPQPSFSWAVSGGGTIDASGLFTAITPGGPFTATASVGAVNDSVTLNVNAPPTVATAAAIDANPVTTTSAHVSVLGDDNAGEAALKYTWSATGPSTVTFTPNNSNAAKSSLATFKKQGSYTLTATIKDASGMTVASSVAVIVNQTYTSVKVTPAGTYVKPNLNKQFTASAHDQFDLAMTTQPAFDWTVSGGGTINASTGLFHAGANPGGPYVVTASSGGIGGTANVTVDLAPNIEITAPLNGATYAAPATFTLETDAVDLDGTIAKVEFFQNNVKIGTSTATPFSFTVTDLAAGSYTYKAKAYDNGNLTDTSSTILISVTIVDPNPTVATPASASPNPTNGTSTSLSVLGADNGGESNLTYTWSSTGPATVSFSANGTNAAKNSTATFSKAGSYTFTATITDATNLSVTSSVNVLVNQTLTVIDVTPVNGVTSLNGTLQYLATAKDQFNTPMSPQPSFNWTVGAGGSISSSGLFTAGGEAGGPFWVTATSGTVSGLATITISNDSPYVVNQAAANPSLVSGATTNLSVLGGDDGFEPNLIYAWSLLGSPSAPVSFSVNNTNAAKNTIATFSKAGSYSFRVTITDSSGLSITSSVNVVVNQTATSVQVTPSTAGVSLNGQHQFSAVLADQFSKAMASQPSFTWSVNGGGIIDASGLFIASEEPGGPFLVTGTGGGFSGTASVTISDAAPYIVTAASASPNPVDGITTTLSVLAGDDARESMLKYTWDVQAGVAGNVSFSINGTNASKNAIATFAHAGNYTLRATISDESNLSITSSIAVIVNSTTSFVTVSPSSAVVSPSATQHFTAAATNQFGDPAGNVAWSVSGGGSIDQFGLFSAGTTAGGPYVVTASKDGISNTASVTVSNPELGSPSFDAGANPEVLEDSGGATVYNWATNITSGSDDPEITLSFQITGNTAPDLFSEQPSIDSAGTLTFSTAADAFGSATISVVLASSVQTSSAPVSFTIVVIPVNDAPTVFVGLAPEVLEDSATHTVYNWAAFSSGTVNEGDQTLAIQVTNDNNALFLDQPLIDAGGTLTFTPAPNAFGTANVAVTVQDNGGTNHGGVDSASQTFNITVVPVNDAPYFAAGNNITTYQTGLQTYEHWATQISSGTPNESNQTLTFEVSVMEQGLFSQGPSIDSNGTLTFVPAPEANGTTTVSVTLRDSGGTDNYGVDTFGPIEFTITIVHVNKAPTFTPGANVVVYEDLALYSAQWATNISAGAEEYNQFVTFETVQLDNLMLFTTPPMVDSSGNLTFEPAPNAFGVAHVMVTLRDNGGTENGGIDAISSELTITVVGINDAPSFTAGSPVIVNNLAGAQTFQNWATGISAGPYESQSLQFILTNNNNALFDVQPAISNSGTLSFTPSATHLGSASVTATLLDNGGLLNGGIDRVTQTFLITVRSTQEIVTNVAGTHPLGYGYVLPPTLGRLNGPQGVAVSNVDGRIYIADTMNDWIGSIDPFTNILDIYAGTGSAGYYGDSGDAFFAGVSHPYGVAVHSNGDLYIADTNNFRVRRVDHISKIITTVAGNGTFGSSGDGGDATGAALGYPTSLAFDSQGNLYIADAANNRIRKVNATGVITTIAGTGTSGFSGDGGAATLATLNAPFGVAVDSAGQIYISDRGNGRIRKIGTDGIINTIAGNGTFAFSGDGGPGTAAALNSPSGLALDPSSNLYIADTNNQRIRKLSSNGTMTTFAGNGSFGLQDDAVLLQQAAFANPSDVAIAGDGTIYVSDSYTGRIRRIGTDARPLPPQFVSATVIGTQVTLEWMSTANSSAQHYIVERRFPDTAFYPLDYVDASFPSYTDFSVPLGTEVYYRIRGTNFAGDSDPSQEVVASIQTIPYAPTQLIAVAMGLGQARLTWIDNSHNENRFVIERQSGTGPFIPVGLAHPDIAEFIDTGLMQGTQYTYRVAAANDVGVSGYSNSALVQTAQIVASETPVLSSSVTLSINGTIFNESVLSYQWSATGPAAVTFVDNGSHSARTTVVHFSKAGNYQFTVSLNEAGGSRGSGTLALAVDQNVTSIAVSPNLVTMKASTTQQFTALLSDQFGFPINGESVEWSATRGSGFIEASGLFHAGNSSGTVTIKAQHGSVVGTAAVTLLRPTANDQQVSIQEDSSVNITLTATALNNEALSYSIFDQPANGTVTGTPPHVVYSPNPNFNGTDSFSFLANDGTTDSNAGQITVVVAPVNDPPAAAPDIYYVAAGTSTTIGTAEGVIVNDFDLEGNVLSAVLTESVANGTLDLQPSGAFTYTPAPGFTGIDSFSYFAHDGELDSNVVSVTLVVSAQAAPAFSALVPANNTWTTRRPIISGEISGAGIIQNSLVLELHRVVGAHSIPVAVLTPDFALNHFEASIPFDLEESSYEMKASILNAVGNQGTASWIFKVDVTMPEVSGFPPPSPTSSKRPQIAATYSDTLSQINPASVRLNIDLTDVPGAELNASASGFSYTPATDLTYGTHRVELRVGDFAGNISITTTYLVVIDANIDITKPIIANVSPAANALLSCKLAAPAVLSVSYSDDLSGINPGDPESVQLFIDNQRIDLPAGAVTAAGLSYALSTDLPDGPHTWQVAVWDMAGNGPTLFDSTFVADSTPPVLVGTVPAYDIVGIEPLTQFSGVLSDNNGSGINWSTLAVSFNGVAYPAIKQGSFKVILPQPIDVPCTVVVAVNDLAGNHLQAEKTYTPALSSFTYVDEQEHDVAVPSPNFSLRNRHDNHAQYILRAAVAPGVNSLSVTGPGMASAAIIGNVATVNITGIYPGLNQSPLTFSAQDAEGHPIFIRGSINFPDVVTNPLNLIASPIGSAQVRSPITFTVWDGIVASVTVSIDGGAPFSTKYTQIDTNTFSGSVKPAAAYTPGVTHYYTVTAVSGAGLSTSVTNTFTADDTDAPIIQVDTSGFTSGYLNNYNRMLSFTVADRDGYGVAIDKVTVSYTVNGITSTGTPTISSEFDGADGHTYRYQFVFPTTLSTGDNVSFLIQAEDLKGALPNVGMATGSFNVDKSAPVISNLDPVPGVISTGTSAMSFDLLDANSGTRYYSATLIDATTYVNSFTYDLLGYTSGNGNNTTNGIPASVAVNPSMVAGHSYILRIEAVDRLDNYATRFIRYLTAADTTGPAITTSANFPSKNISANIEDKESGIDFNSISATLGGVALGMNSFTLNEIQTQGNVVWKMPDEIDYGTYTFVISAMNLSGQLSTVTTSFTFSKTPLPIPVVSSFDIQPGIVTASGTIPSSPGDLIGLEVSANGATVNSVNFDLSSHEFSVTFAKITASSFSYSIAYKDVEGFTGPSATGSKTFGSGTVVPPLVSPLPVAPPPGAIVADADNPPRIYWDFDPADIHGVSKPQVSDGPHPFRGWIPATKFSAVHISGTIVGNNPPYIVKLEGEGFQVSDKHVNGNKFTATLTFTSEGLAKVRATAQDATGQGAPSFTRSVIYDIHPPLKDYPLTGWIWKYAALEPQAPQEIRPDFYAGTNPPAFANGTSRFFDEEHTNSNHPSGIERMNAIIDGSVVQNHVIQPKDFEFNTYALVASEEYYNIANTAWSAKLPLLLPNGHVAKMGDRIDFTQSGTVHCLNGDFALYDVNSWGVPTTLQVSDAAGNQTQLSGKTTGYPISAFPPSKIAAGHPYLITMDNLRISDHFGSESRITMVFLDADWSLDRKHARVLVADVPGIFPYLLIVENPGYPPEITTGEITVVDPYLVGDENADGETYDEDPERQRVYGITLPINDDFEVDGHTPDYKLTNGANDTTLRRFTYDANINTGTLWFSSNLRLWADKYKTKELGTFKGPGPFDPLIQNQTHIFGVNLNDIHGEFYVECLPFSRQPVIYNEYYPMHPPGTPPGAPLFEHRFVAFSVYDVGTQRIDIHAVTDRNEGRREGEPTVSVDGPASVDVTSGSLKAVFPVARSGSRIIPDIFVHYNSRDAISGELNTRLKPAIEMSNPYVAGDDFFQGECPPNFRMTLEMRIIRGAKVMHLIDDDGRRVAFHPDREAKPDDMDELAVIWKAEDRKGHFSTIQTVKQTHFNMQRAYYVLTHPKDNKQYLFEKATGKLKEIRDVRNNTATLEYDEYGGTRGHLQRIVDNRGIFVAFHCDGNGNVQITDPAGHNTSISRSGVFGPLGNYSYKLDKYGYMQNFKSLRGAPYQVNSADGVVSSIFRVDDSRSMKFTYDFPGQGTSVDHYGTLQEQVRRYNYAYDRELQVWTSISFNDGQGNASTLSQAASIKGLITNRSTMLGGNWPLEYDEGTGLQKAVTDPDNHRFTVEHGPVPNGRYAPQGPNYLQNFLPVSQTADGKSTPVNYGFNGDGFLATVTDSFGQGRVKQWDAFGLPRRIEGPRQGYAREIEYDDVGRVTLVREIGGNVPMTETRYRNDALGRPREVLFNDGRKLVYHYDARGHLICTEGPFVTATERQKGIANGGSPATFYEAGGQWVYSVDANGNSVSRAVNSLGAVTSYTNSAGAVTYFTEFNALLLPKYTDLPPARDGGQGRIVEHTYDLLGREIQRILPSKAGAQRIEHITYKLGGRVIEVTDPRGVMTTYTRLKSGRLEKIENLSTGSVTRLGYDGNGTGNLSTLLGLAGNTRSYGQYDLLQQFGIEGTSLTVSHQRDAAGEVTDTTLPGGITVHAPVDARGRTGRVSVSGTNVAEYLYEDSARPMLPTSIKDLEAASRVDQDVFDAYWRPGKSQQHIVSPSLFGPVPLPGGGVGNLPQSQDVEISFTRRNTGEILNFVDGNGNTSHNAYNGAGWLTGSFDQDNLGSTTSYFQSGMIASVTNERGKTTQYFYEEETGFLKSMVYPDGHGVVFTRDLNGNILEARYAVQMDAGGAIVETPGVNVTPLRFKYKYDDHNRVIEKSDPELHKFTYDYYTSGLLAQVTDPDGKSVRYVYDGAGRMIKTIAMPGPQVTSVTYAANGQVEKVDTPDGRNAKYTYDNRGRMILKTASGEGTTEYTYRGGNLSSITDALGNKRFFIYDTAHRLVETQYPGLQRGVPAKQAYDTGGFVIGSSDEAGHVFSSENHKNGRRKALTLMNPQVGQPANPQLLHTFTYDGNTPTNDGSVSWTLDNAGRIANCSSGCSYQYNHPLGLMTQKSYGGVTLDYQYDNAAYLFSVSDGTNSLTFNNRTPAGLPLDADYSNGVHAEWQYQFQQFVSQMKYTKNGALVSQWDATYDPAGRRQSLAVTTQDGQPASELVSYGYDAASRLSRENRTLNGQFTQTDFTYDFLGNRKSKTMSGPGAGANAGTENYFYDNRYALARIDHSGGEWTEFDYDANGNTTSKTKFSPTVGQLENTTFNWDALNRLTSATKQASSSTNTATFDYDPFGWQLKSQTINGEARTFRYGVDGELLSETVPGSGTRTYVNASLDHVLWSIDSQGSPQNATKFWHTDINGSVFAIADAAGNVLERQRYDAFGKTEITDASGAVVQGASSIGNRVGFQGRMNLEELGIQYFRNRFYDPQASRWLSKDPLGLDTGLNDYWAFSDDGVNRIDPLGLDDDDDGPKVGPFFRAMYWLAGGYRAEAAARNQKSATPAGGTGIGTGKSGAVAISGGGNVPGADVAKSAGERADREKQVVVEVAKTAGNAALPEIGAAATMVKAGVKMYNAYNAVEGAKADISLVEDFAKNGPTRNNIVPLGTRALQITISIFLDKAAESRKTKAGTPETAAEGKEGKAVTTKTVGSQKYTQNEAGETIEAEGVHTGPHPGREKGSRPEPAGGRLPGDHRGHLIPEGSVEDPATVNIKDNIISERASSNLGPKKAFDNRVAKVAAENPDSVVKSRHEPLRRDGETRPYAVTHWITVDGETVHGETILNPKE